MMEDFCLVDVETTGLDPTWHEVIEVAAIRVNAQSLDVIAESVMRIEPRWPERATPETIEVNGYDAATWNGLALDVVCDEMTPLLDRATLAGQHVAFDAAFLRRMYDMREPPFYGLDEDPPVRPRWRRRTLDTMSYGVLLQSMGIVPNASLDALCEAFGIERPTPHRAYDDAKACLKIVRCLRETWRQTFGRREEDA